MSFKEKLLNQLKQKMEENKELPFFNDANLVFGEGNLDAKILFIGEAPGANEDRLLRPFVGRAGKLLDKMLISISLSRESVYITNIVKRRPPQNRDPSPQEIEVYRPYLQKQVEIIRPKFIATLGRFSMNYFLPDAKISDTHGKLIRTEEYVIFPLYHPAATFRSTKMRLAFEKDFKILKSVLSKK